MKDEFNEFEKKLWSTITDIRKANTYTENAEYELKELQSQLLRANKWISDVVGESE